MKGILLLLALSSFATASISPLKLHQQKSAGGRELQKGGKLEAIYRIGMFFTTSCNFPPTVTFVIECSDTAVALDDDENLGLAKCESIDAKTLQCTDNSLNSFVVAPAEVIMKCVGDTENDVRMSVALLEEAVDCSEVALTGSPSRSISVERICSNEDDKLVETVPATGQCLNAVGVGSFGCENEISCGGGVPCTAGMTLPIFGLEVLDTTVPNECLFSSQPPPPLPALSDIGPGNTAKYSVLFRLEDAVDCVLDYPVEVTFSCGDEEHDGKVYFLPESQPAMKTCKQKGPSQIVCEIDPSPGELPLDLDVQISAACTGTSVEALAISVEVTPQRMNCVDVGLGSGSVSWGVRIRQFCTGVKTAPGGGEFANVFAQDCSPRSTELDLTFTLDTDDDGIPDLLVPDMICTYQQGNCFDDLFCEADGSQELGSIRSTVPAAKVDLECLVVGSAQDLPSTTNDPTCVDNSKKRNIFFGIPINGKERDCAWLSNASKKVKKWYCQNDKRAQQRCAACGKVTEDANPPSTIDAYKVQKRNCAWLEERSVVFALCKLSKDARKACKKTCGRCR